jgi:hypothetical protein
MACKTSIVANKATKSVAARFLANKALFYHFRDSFHGSTSIAFFLRNKKSSSVGRFCDVILTLAIRAMMTG